MTDGELSDEQIERLAAEAEAGYDPAKLRPRPTFTCPDCGRTSHNPNDARERYCGACHTYPYDRTVIDPPGLIPIEERRRLQAARRAERNLTIPDGQHCINCHKPAVRGFITHARNCPEWGG